MMHTPGPWRISEFEKSTEGNAARMVMADDGFSVTWVGERSARENIANANLITAAPELLAACELVLDSTPDNEEDYRPILRAAIKKAKGE